MLCFVPYWKKKTLVIPIYTGYIAEEVNGCSFKFIYDSTDILG